MEASGSIWNAGSWFWEEKNYTRFAQERMTELINQANFTIQDWNFSLSAKKVKAEASISIRKGKSILVYEFTIDVEFVASKEAEQIQGTFRIQEFTQDDLDDLQLTVRASSQGSGTQVKTLLSRHGKKEIKKLVQVFEQNFRELESNREKLENDRKMRQEELQKAEQAKQETGEYHQQLIQSQQQLDKELQERAFEQQDEQVRGKGSEWNAGSYFWEEKSVSWANEALRDLIAQTNIQIPSGQVIFTHIDIEGESSLSIRKAKKIIGFQYDIKIQWEGKVFDGSQQVLAQCNGEIRMPDVGLDSEGNYDINFVIKSNNPGQQVVEQAVRKAAPTALHNQIAEFVQRLRSS